MTLSNKRLTELSEPKARESRRLLLLRMLRKETVESSGSETSLYTSRHALDRAVVTRRGSAHLGPLPLLHLFSVTRTAGRVDECIRRRDTELARGVPDRVDPVASLRSFAKNASLAEFGSATCGLSHPTVSCSLP